MPTYAVLSDLHPDRQTHPDETLIDGERYTWASNMTVVVATIAFAKRIGRLK
jgi:hypothetical protein